MVDSANLAAIDLQLQDWQQGDAIFGSDISFTYVADYNRPITHQSAEAAAADDSSDDRLGTIALDVPGFVVLTQTCDLIRKCEHRPLVQLAALVELQPDVLQEVKKGYRPRYAFVPGVADQNLAADLDCVMTAEKAVLVTEARCVRGCRDDAEARDFALALSRNASRTAFPDDFVTCFRPVQKRILDKHGKPTNDKDGNPTNEGRLLSGLREIRVACSPTWSAPEPAVMLFFIFDADQEVPPDAETIIESLLARFKVRGRFKRPEFRMLKITEMSAAAYLSSSPLDLEHLSQSSR